MQDQIGDGVPSKGAWWAWGAPSHEVCARPPASMDLARVGPTPPKRESFWETLVNILIWTSSLPSPRSPSAMVCMPTFGIRLGLRVSDPSSSLRFHLLAREGRIVFRVEGNITRLYSAVHYTMVPHRRCYAYPRGADAITWKFKPFRVYSATSSYSLSMWARSFSRCMLPFVRLGCL